MPSGLLPRSRLVRAKFIGDPATSVFLKLESEMPTGSFKVRGALHALSVNLQRRPIVEVVASSTGNHGAAVAYAAQRLGVRATIFLPRNPNRVKKAKIAQLGAVVREQGRDLAEAFDAASDYVKSTGAFFLNDATDPDIPIGASTIADEIFDELPRVDAIYVPVGDTALIRGVGTRAKQHWPVRIVGVQAENAPSYCLSWRSGSVVVTAAADTIADGLATRTPVDHNVRAIRDVVDEMRLVTEDAMLAAMGVLMAHEHVVAEPSGAASVAAFLAEQRPTRPRTVVLLITGSNVDPALLARVKS